MRKKMQQQENLLSLKRKTQDDDWETNSSASKLSAQRAMFSQIWTKIQEQEKLLSQPIDQENSLKKSLQGALRKMIENFQRTLHLKMLLC